MTEPLKRRLAEGRHDFHRSDADRQGLLKRTLASWVSAGLLESLGGGDYLIVAPLVGVTAFERARCLHLRRCGSLLAGRPDLYLVGRSSAVAHGVAVLSEPERVEVSRRPRVQASRGVLHSFMPWGSETVVIEGLRCQRLEEACVQIAAAHGPRAGLVTADAAAHAGVTRSSLLQASQVFGKRPGAREARLAVSLADGRVESVGESLVRWEAHVAGVRLVPQVVVHDDVGRFVARVDFVIEGTNVVVEFDGMGKYASPGDLRREKRREMALTRLGYRVLRFTFDDMRRPGYVGSMLARAAATAA